MKKKDLAEIPHDEIASAIIEISKGMKIINEGRLNRKALLTLLYDMSKVPKHKIDLVLNSLLELESTYLKKKTQGE